MQHRIPVIIMQLIPLPESIIVSLTFIVLGSIMEQIATYETLVIRTTFMNLR